MTIIFVRSETDVGRARREARHAAAQIGFDRQTTAALELAVTELATNLVQHGAIEARIELTQLDRGGSAGLEVVSRDRGPGIADFRRAMTDRFSTRGTSGCGLGAVRRVMDEFEIHSAVAQDLESDADTATPGGTVQVGTLITAKKWARGAIDPSRFVYCVTTRALPGESFNGDSYLVEEDDRGLLVAVVDGLGHGPEAAAASATAISYLKDAQSEQQLSLLVAGLHESLRATRAVAATLVRICPQERRLFHTAIGNVNSRMYPSGLKSLITKPGVLGAGTPVRPKITEATWSSSHTLIVYSDGLSSGWDLTAIPGLLQEAVTSISHYLMQNHYLGNDDATVVVAREAQGR